MERGTNQAVQNANLLNTNYPEDPVYSAKG